MLKINISQIQPISHLARRYSDFIRQAQKEGAVILMRRSKPTAVLVDFPLWQKLEKIRRQQEEKEAINVIKKSENEHSQGKARVLKSLKTL